MTQIAYLMSRDMLPGQPDTRPDFGLHAIQFGPLRGACAARGIDLVETVWDEPGIEGRGFDGFVVGTVWDYVKRPEEFIAALRRIERMAPLWNNAATIVWNTQKRYLIDLERAGARLVPTLWRERADETTIRAAFDELDCERIVVKPEVGAGAWRQVLITRGETLPPADQLPPSRTMIQPFIESIETEGEYSLLYFGRAFSHAVQKLPKAGEYRIQAMYGGTDRGHTPNEAELAAAQRVIDAVPGELLYARVDMVRAADGGLILMELELIEPYLYPVQDDDFATRFAAALHTLLAKQTKHPTAIG
ncbi:MAG: hypothetical protein ACIAQF_10095 [Phycisphaerales bacterium JB065]